MPYVRYVINTIYFTNFLCATSAMLMLSEREEKRGSRCALKYNVMSGSGGAQVLCDEIHFCFTRFVYKLLQCYSFLTFPSQTGLV